MMYSIGLRIAVLIKLRVDKFLKKMIIIKHNAAVAQSVEQRTENPRVNSSILFGGTNPGSDSNLHQGFLLLLLSGVEEGT